MPPSPWSGMLLVFLRHIPFPNSRRCSTLVGHCQTVTQVLSLHEYANLMQMSSFHLNLSSSTAANVYFFVFIENATQHSAVNYEIYVLSLVHSVIGIYVVFKMTVKSLCS